MSGDHDLIDVPEQPRRVVEVNGHAVDLRRVQCISPVNDGRYSVTLVSGWELKVNQDDHDRSKLVNSWTYYLNMCD